MAKAKLQCKYQLQPWPTNGQFGKLDINIPSPSAPA